MLNEQEREYFEDDRFMISEEVKRMSPEERKREIARLEEEGRKERDRLRRERGKSVDS